MINDAPPQPVAETTGESFAELGLEKPLVLTLHKIGFDHPTPIQAGVIRYALDGHDVIGLAETGSGKTAAFALPMAQRLVHSEGVRGLILCPTREIALQTKNFLEVVGREHALKTACLIGGVKFGPQLADLRADPDIVVATPGRMWDHYERGNLKLDRVEMVVLDEGDHMLDLGFLPQIHRVMEAVPKERQTLIFSATLPEPIERLTRRYLDQPQRVDLRPPGRTAEGIEHRLYLVKPDDMRDCLISLVHHEDTSTIVFLRRKVDTEWAYRQLAQEGVSVARIHSDRSQKQRVEALTSIRQGETRVLLATDIAARGIDIPVVGHIVNFGLPEQVEDYVHRAGRTARGKLSGVVSSVATWRDLQPIQWIERAIGEKLPRCEAPGVKPYVERKKTIKGRKRLRRRLL